jgi:aspartokinase
LNTISDCVAAIIAKQPYLEEALSQKIINYAALAENLNPLVSKMLKKPVKDGAILMALRRYASPTDTQKSLRLKEVLNGLGDITVRSKLIVFTFQNSGTLIQNHAQILSTIATNQQVFYTFTRGIHESTLISSASEEAHIRDHFKTENILNFQGNLSAISIRLPQGNTAVAGLYYQIFKRLAWEGISLQEVISTTNEFIILVEDELVDRAFSAIKKLQS